MASICGDEIPDQIDKEKTIVIASILEQVEMEDLTAEDAVNQICETLVDKRTKAIKVFSDFINRHVQDAQTRETLHRHLSILEELSRK